MTSHSLNGFHNGINSGKIIREIKSLISREIQEIMFQLDAKQSE